MELDPDYTFVPLTPRHYMGIEDKDTQHYLKKWGLHGHISIQDFCFNEPFQTYNKYHIAEKFFKSTEVVNNLKIKEGDTWFVKGIKAELIDVKPVPCNVLNTSFFDRLLDPKNNIVNPSGSIQKRYDIEIDGFLVSDNLREMLLDEECDQYNLYTTEEKEELIFRLFEMFVLGGSLCQYEDELKPYLDVTKKVYKELVRVRNKGVGTGLSVDTTALQIVAKDKDGRAFFPADPNRRQNIGFLLIDGPARQITTLIHQLGSFRW